MQQYLKHSQCGFPRLYVLKYINKILLSEDIKQKKAEQKQWGIADDKLSDGCSYNLSWSRRDFPTI